IEQLDVGEHPRRLHVSRVLQQTRIDTGRKQFVVGEKGNRLDSVPQVPPELVDISCSRKPAAHADYGNASLFVHDCLLWRVVFFRTMVCCCFCTRSRIGASASPLSAALTDLANESMVGNWNRSTTENSTCRACRSLLCSLRIRSEWPPRSKKLSF